MVVLQCHIAELPLLIETKRKLPVLSDDYGPDPCPLSDKRMQPIIRRHCELIQRPCSSNESEHLPQPVHIANQPFDVSRLEKASEVVVSDTFDLRAR